ncbi:MAG: hypothetical protein GXY23_13615 [Myxococcales bacterium]|nr:hypothetical protein [Myxococcales bacterium]
MLDQGIRILRFVLALLVVVSAGLPAPRAAADRPFVVEEVEPVGKKLVRLESWVLATKDVFAHSALLGIGAGDHLEVKLGAMHGGVFGNGMSGYGILGPLVQIDAMFFAPTSWGRPGLGLYVGTLPKLGYQVFSPPGWSGFGGFRITQPILDEVLYVHGNLGVSLGGDGDGVSSGRHASRWLTGGLGLEARFSEAASGILEYFHRDPYSPYARWAGLQGGFRYAFRETIALDGGLGLTLPYATGDSRVRVFGTLGIRLTTPVRW